MLRGKDIVCISSLDWRAMWTSKQQVMHRLSQTNRVLYVEEPVTMLAPLKVPAQWRRWRAIAPRLRRVSAGLWTLTPPPLLPFGNMRPGVNDINQALLARYVRWAMGRLRFEDDYILWSYLPTVLPLLDRLAAPPPDGSSLGAPGAPPSGASSQNTARRGAATLGAPGEGMSSRDLAPVDRESLRLGREVGSGLGRRLWDPRPAPSLVVYHCVDEHSAFPGFVDPEVVRAYDDGLTRRADLVITTSESLRAARLSLNPHTYTVFNAADAEIFARALDPALGVPADMASIPQPRLGVVGLHDSRLDVDAIEALARADQGWQIVLIGPLKQGQVDEARLRKYPNVHLLGERRRNELPAYLKGMAVALIPYKANELTRNIFPLKLFEYLAAGLPVVAGGLPELQRFAGIIGLPASPAEYVDEVRRALAEDEPQKRATRAALAAENTWDHRVEEISALVEEALARAHQAPAWLGPENRGAT